MPLPAPAGATLLDPATGTACVVTEITVAADVVALDASISVIQRFRNPLETAIEAVYVFPLPPLAAVTAMRATLGGRTVVARLKERAEARRDYAVAVAEGRRAALAEEERPSTFTMTIGNLAAGEEAEIVLELVGPVDVTAQLDAVGVVTAWNAALRLPTVVAPRYTEGQALGGADVGTGVASDTDRVPDASRVTPAVGVGVAPDLAWHVRLEPAGLPLGAIEAPDGADRTPEPGGAVMVSGRGRCDADLTVRWQVSPTTLAVAAAVHPDGEGVEGREGDATVSITLVPPVGTVTRRPADVVIALDRSGSMEGWKMRTAVRAARRLLDTLSVADRVGLVAFDTEVIGPELGLLRLTGPNRERLHQVLKSVEARGGTELTDAITAAGHLLGSRSPERERLVLLVTDVEVSGEQQAVAAAQATGARFVVVGVDTAVNHGLLQRLGSATDGSSTAVTDASELDRAVEVARHRLGAPALQHLTVDAAGLVPGSLAGEHRDSVWPDAVARLGVRINHSDAQPVSVVLQADGPSGPWVQRLEAAPTPNPAGRLTWARHRLRALEDDFDGGGPTQQGELVQLSLSHGVLCRFTAFVAVDEHGDLVGTGTPPVTVAQPSELPRAWMATGIARPMAAMPSAAMAPRGAARRATRFAQMEDRRATDVSDASFDPRARHDAMGPSSSSDAYLASVDEPLDMDVLESLERPPSSGRTPASARDEFWATRPSPTSPDQKAARLVAAVHRAITLRGPKHRSTTNAVADLLRHLASIGFTEPACELVSELVAAGGDVGLDTSWLVVLAPGGSEICRLSLRTHSVVFSPAPAAASEDLRRGLAARLPDGRAHDTDVAMALALLAAVSA